MDARVRTVINGMQRRLGDLPSIRSLSESVSLTPARLRQLFKMETGQSPKQYLKELRLREAEKLVRNTFLSIKEITFLIGARDVSHFVREFKKKHGLTPRVFRAEMRQLVEPGQQQGERRMTARKARSCLKTSFDNASGRNSFVKESD